LSFLSSFVGNYYTSTTEVIHLYPILFVLAAIFFIGLCRSELQLLWNGVHQAMLPMVEKKQLAPKSHSKEDDVV